MKVKEELEWEEQVEKEVSEATAPAQIEQAAAD